MVAMSTPSVVSQACMAWPVSASGSPEAKPSRATTMTAARGSRKNKRPPWIRLCRATGGAPLGGRRRRRFGGGHVTAGCSRRSVPASASISAGTPSGSVNLRFTWPNCAPR